MLQSCKQKRNACCLHVHVHTCLHVHAQDYNSYFYGCNVSDTVSEDNFAHCQSIYDMHESTVGFGIELTTVDSKPKRRMIVYCMPPLISTQQKAELELSNCLALRTSYGPVHTIQSNQPSPTSSSLWLLCNLWIEHHIHIIWKSDITKTICISVIMIEYGTIHFQSEGFSEVEITKTKPEEVITASQVVEDVKEESLETPDCIPSIACQHKGTTLVLNSVQDL